MPFAGYKNFADCVRKNSGGSIRNPEAYCGHIMHKVEGGVKAEEAIGQWNKMTEAQHQDIQDMIDQERTEHPSFRNDQILQIIHDHLTSLEEAQTFIPPEAGNLPAEGKRILASAYRDYRKKGYDQERASKAAWGAVKNAGWTKKGDKWVKEQLTIQPSVTKPHPMKPTTGPPVAADSGSPLQRYWPPSEISPQQTGDGRIYTAPGANLKLQKAKERFSWLAPFKIVKEASYRLMRGEAINVGKSRNRVPYTEDELLRGARTLAGKPLLHNHLETVEEARSYLKGMRVDGSTFDPAIIPPLVKANIESMIADGNMSNGPILDAEYEDGAVEYVTRIERPTAIAMADAGLIKAPSIGAVPRNQSMTNPKGIMFEDMSMITDPETPGDPDATMKMMEKIREMLQPDSIQLSGAATLNERLAITLELRSRIVAELRERIKTQFKEASKHYIGLPWNAELARNP